VSVKSAVGSTADCGSYFTYVKAVVGNGTIPSISTVVSLDTYSTLFTVVTNLKQYSFPFSNDV